MCQASWQQVAGYSATPVAPSSVQPDRGYALGSSRRAGAYAWTRSSCVHGNMEGSSQRFKPCFSRNARPCVSSLASGLCVVSAVAY